MLSTIIEKYRSNKKEIDNSYLSQCLIHEFFLEKKELLSLSTVLDEEELLKVLSKDTLSFFAQLLSLQTEIPKRVMTKYLQQLLDVDDINEISSSKIVHHLNRILGYATVEKELQEYFVREPDKNLYHTKLMIMFVLNDPIYIEEEDFLIPDGKMTFPSWEWTDNRYVLRYGGQPIEKKAFHAYAKTKNILWKKRILFLSKFYLSKEMSKDERSLLYTLIKRDIKYDNEVDQTIYLKARQHLDSTEA